MVSRACVDDSGSRCFDRRIATMPMPVQPFPPPFVVDAKGYCVRLQDAIGRQRRLIDDDEQFLLDGMPGEVMNETRID
jgi:hypothetical protein